MSGCDYEQEGFCILQDCEDVKEPCVKMDKARHCTAKPEDLTEYCNDCGEPTTDCGCGTCWVLVEDSHGKLVAVMPKEYRKLLKVSSK